MNSDSLWDFMCASIDSFYSYIDEEPPFSEIDGMLLAMCVVALGLVTR